MIDCRANRMSSKSNRTAHRGKTLPGSSHLIAPEIPGSAKSNPDQPVGVWRQDWVLGLLLVVVTTVAYLPAWHGTSIWDDDAHLTRPELRSMDGLVRIWTQPGVTQQYYPLVHTLFWGEHQLWGDATLGYHLVNLLLHCISALLLVKILRRLEFRERGSRRLSSLCTRFKWNQSPGFPNSRTCSPECFISARFWPT